MNTSMHFTLGFAKRGLPLKQRMLQNLAQHFPSGKGFLYSQKEALKYLLIAKLLVIVGLLSLFLQSKAYAQLPLGQWDTTFNYGQGPSYQFNQGFGVGGQVYDIEEDSQGRILIGGNTYTINGTFQGNIMRMLPNGRTDLSFNINPGFVSAHPPVFDIELQPNGKILLGGVFTDFAGQSRGRILRLNEDGTLDNSFQVGTGFNNNVGKILYMSNGDMIVGGTFTSYNNVAVNRICRLDSNGNLVNTFSANFDGEITDMEIYNNELYVVGNFTTVSNTGANRIVKINPTTGALLSGLNIGTGFNRSVNDIDITPTGQIVVSGNFTTYNEMNRYGVIVLNNNGSIFSNSFGYMPQTSGQGWGPPSSYDIVGGMKLISSTRILVISMFVMNQGGGGGGFGGITETLSLRAFNLNGSRDFSVFNNVSMGGQLLGNGCPTIRAANNGDIVIGGDFNSVNGASMPSEVIRFTSAGAVVNNWAQITVGPNAAVRTVSEISPNEYIIGGSFTRYNNNTKGRIIKTDSTGVELPFNTGGIGFNGDVNTTIVQSDGKIIVGGSFTSLNSGPSRTLVRFNPNGTVDNSFFCNITSDIYKAIPLSDGKIFVIGSFTTVNGVNSRSVAIINADGSRDANFNIGNFFPTNSSFARSIFDAVEVDSGKIVVVGGFNTLNSITYGRIIRINRNGTVDNTFNTGGVGFNSAINAIAKDANGRLVVGGLFNRFNGSNVVGRIARLNRNGSLDTTFNRGGSGFNTTVDNITILNDDKLLVGGGFSSYNGISILRYARLMPNGSLDPSTPNEFVRLGDVLGITLSSSGKAIMFGNFFSGYNRSIPYLTRLGTGLNCTRPARLSASGPSTLCQNATVTLTASESANGTYLWSNGATTRTITVNSPGFYSVRTFSGDCGSIESTPIDLKEIVCQSSKVFVGANGGDWSVASNWTPVGVPSVIDSIIIPSNTQVQVSSGSITAKSIHIMQGGVLESNATFNVSHLIRNNGTVRGRIILRGNSESTAPLTLIGNGSYEHLRLNFAGRTTTQAIIRDSVRLTGELDLNGHTLNCNNRPLVFASDNGFSSSLAPMNSPAQLLNATGIIVEQWLAPTNNRGAGGWHNLTVPLRNQGIRVWEQRGNVYASGTFLDVNPTTNTSIWFYNPTDRRFPTHNSFVRNINQQLRLNPGIGVRVWMNNQFYTRAGAPKLIFRGFPFVGDTTINLLYCNSGNCGGQNLAENGYNLVGNPMLSPIDWNEIAKVNVSNGVEIWSSVRNSYTSFINGVPLNGGSNKIAAGQAFFVQATAANASLSFSESDKLSAATNTNAFRAATGSTVPYLKVGVAADGGNTDEAVLFVNATASATFSLQEDFLKLMNPSHNIWFVSADGRNLKGNSSSLEDGYSFEVRVPAGEGFTLNFENNEPLLNAYLIEDADGNRYSMNAMPQFIGTGAAQRFRLISSIPTESKAELGGVQIKLYPNPAWDKLYIEVPAKAIGTELTLSNSLGKELTRIPVNSTSLELNLQGFTEGVYNILLPGGRPVRFIRIYK